MPRVYRLYIGQHCAMGLVQGCVHQDYVHFTQGLCTNTPDLADDFCIWGSLLLHYELKSADSNCASTVSDSAHAAYFQAAMSAMLLIPRLTSSSSLLQQANINMVWAQQQTCCYTALSSSSSVTRSGRRPLGTCTQSHGGTDSVCSMWRIASGRRIYDLLQAQQLSYIAGPE